MMDKRTKKQRENFLNKVVDVVDDMLYDIGLGEVVEVDWKYKHFFVMLTHDTYGVIGRFPVSEAYKAFYRLKEHYEDLKKSVYIRETIGFEIVEKVKAFIEEKRNPRPVEVEVEEEAECVCECTNEYYASELVDVEEYEDYDDEDYDDEEVEVEVETESEEAEVEQCELIKAVLNSGSVACPECGSTHYKRNGKKKGVQQYVCKDCGRYFTETTASK